jgi:type I restriction enzyme S subunit
LGKSALVGDISRPTVFESNMMRFSVKQTRALPGYVSLWLRSPAAREQMRRCAKQAVAQASINQADVRSIMLPLPGLQRQRSIVEVMQTVHDSARLATNRLEGLLSLFDAALSELVPGNLRVKKI